MAILKENLIREIKNFLANEDIIFWLDEKSIFADVVEEIQSRGELNFPIVRFQGSFLESMIEINRYLGKIYPEKFVIYITGVTEKEIEKSPFYECYTIAHRWNPDLNHPVRMALEGIVPAKKIESIITQGENDFRKTQVLTQKTKESINSSLPVLLEKYSVKQLGLELVNEKSNVLTSSLLDEKEILRDLKPYFATHYGYEGDEEELEKYIYKLASHLFQVEFYQDLQIELSKGQKVEVSDKQFQNIKYVLENLRKNYKERYIELEEQVSSELFLVKNEILENHIQKGQNILGEIDTFEFEERYSALLCISLMEKNNYSEALGAAEIRLKTMDNTEERSIWLTRDSVRERLWLWIEKACKLNLKIQEVVYRLLSFRELNLDEFLNRYSETDGLWQLDCYFREMITEYNNLKMNFHADERVNIIEENRKLSLEYYNIINNVNTLFSHSCEMKGFLPESKKYLQRNFYNQYIHSNIGKGKFVLIVVDALRYELGCRLSEELKKETYEKRIRLEPLFAELPTQTSIGMNALFPVSGDDKTLNPIISLKDKNMSIKGFKVNQFTVSTIGDRKRVLQEKTGIKCEWISLEDFHRIKIEENENVRNAEILILHSREIDEIGEMGVNPAENINYFEYTINKIKSAIYKLVNIGYSNYLICSDHGFMVIGDTKPEIPEEPLTGYDIYLDRRFLYSRQEFENEQYVRASQKDLYYTTEESGYFYFPKHIFPLKKDSLPNFYHGGNSLQERVVPVLSMNVVKQYKSDNIKNYVIKSLTCEESIDTLHRFKILLDTLENNMFFNRKIEIELFSKLEGVSVEIQKMSHIEASDNRFNLEVGRETEVFFQVHAEKYAEVRLHLRYKDNQNQQQIVDLDTTYKTLLKKATVIAVQNAEAQPIADPEISRILSHLKEYDSITEQAILSMFPGRAGSRTHRRFSRFIKEMKEQLPFEIQVDGQNSSEGTVYRRIKER